MENTIHTIENLLQLSAFSIPQYQRAFAWEQESQLVAFLADLRQQTMTRRNNPAKDYFLGTFLLHEISPGQVHIVDGQQRLTTSVIFAACALAQENAFPVGKVNSKFLRHCFIYDNVRDFQRFRTIDEDNPFFRSYVLRLPDASIEADSPSSTRLKNAFDFFAKSVLHNEWEDLIHTLMTAKAMIYSVTNAADATLIFELQNDRGKRLTDLEALKSYLMHLVYINAVNPDDRLKVIQTHFAHIYRTVEQLAEVLSAPDEDSILAYHCAAYLSWSGNEWRRPKELVKKIVRSMSPGEPSADWVVQFAADLRASFAAVRSALESRDTAPEFAQLTIFGQLASFWPLIIKTYRTDTSDAKTSFRLACRLMEVFAVKGYGFSVRADAGQPALYNCARDFKEDFTELHNFLHSMSSWYDIPARFEAGVDRPSLYSSNKAEARYLLWRYENHLRSKQGQAAQHLGWREYLQPVDNRTRLSIEHVAAQNNPIASTQAAWEEGQPVEDFSVIALNRLGNLVIDFQSGNSAKGNGDFSDKLELLEGLSTFLSQGELKKWATRNGQDHLTWDVTSIKQRHADLMDFVLETWNPSTYFTPTITVPSPEEAA